MIVANVQYSADKKNMTLTNKRYSFGTRTQAVILPGFIVYVLAVVDLI